MRESTRIAKKMVKLDAKATKINPGCLVVLIRMVKQYTKLMNELAAAIVVELPSGASKVTKDKVFADTLTWLRLILRTDTDVSLRMLYAEVNEDSWMVRHHLTDVKLKEVYGLFSI